VYRQLAGILVAMAQPDEAEQYYHKARAMQEKLIADFPKENKYRAHLPLTDHYLANLWRDTGRPKDAENAYQKALAKQQGLVSEFPEVADYHWESARLQSDLGNLLAAAGRADEARQAFAKVRPAFERALEIAPQRHDIATHLARFLATCPDAEFRDAARAVTLA